MRTFGRSLLLPEEGRRLQGRIFVKTPSSVSNGLVLVCLCYGLNCAAEEVANRSEPKVCGRRFLLGINSIRTAHRWRKGIGARAIALYARKTAH